MEIDLGCNQIKLKINGKEHMITEPTYDQISLMEEAKDDPSVVIKFYTALGLPEEVAKALGVYQLKKLTESLMTPLSEKK